MLKQFESFIEKEHLVTPDDSILIAVSGGIDSMVLLHLFQQSKFSALAVAHCNFQLRAEDSNLDEALVENYCSEKQIPFFSKRFDTESYAQEHGISIQMAARELRFEWFNEIAKKESYNKIALAQHLDDQVETFFINLIRGTGISGMHGIKPLNGNLIRPLLFCTRKEIVNYQKINQVPYREDISNKSDKYLRNNIRHQILPKFEDINANFSRKMDENIRHLREVESLYKEVVATNLEGILTEKEGVIFVNITDLMRLSQTRLHLYELLTPYHFIADTIDKVYAQLKNPNSGKQFTSATHELLFDRNQILIRAKSPIDKKVYHINCCQQVNEPIILIPQKLEAITDLKTGQHSALFDFDKLKFPLKLRRWEKSDYFYPFGMQGKKKLSDFFIDQKLSNFDKENTWLLLSGDDIIWVVGQRADNRYKITKDTKSIYKIKVLWQ